jgi:isocitrate lyase
MDAIGEQAARLRREWETDPRWAGIRRGYSARDVIRLRGRGAQWAGLARHEASRLWELLHGQDAALFPGRAAGADEPGRAAPGGRRLPPVAADADARPGAAQDSFELMQEMIEAGAAGVGLGDTLPPDHESGRPAGMVLIPTARHIERLTAARFAADVLDVPALVIARTGARSACLLTSDSDERDREFLTGERAADGCYQVEPGLYACANRALSFAPYADVLWLEAPEPDLAEARAFASIIGSQYPDKLLGYSCPPPSWRAGTDGGAAAEFPARLRGELAALGYRLQSLTPSWAGRAGSRPPARHAASALA